MSENNAMRDENATRIGRGMLDERILNGDEIPAEALKNVLTSPEPPSGDLLLRYAERLLHHALDARDTEAAALVARLMDADPILDDALYAHLNEHLENEPDAVYAFIRARVSVSIDERWRSRLQVAATRALHIAISDGDAETVVNWLKLIGREPNAYGLGELLHQSILAAQERARGDGVLGKMLILLAVKRDPASLDLLLNDPALVAALPNLLGQALREHQCDPLALLQNFGAELFLVALGRAAAIQSADLFTPASIEQVWALYTTAQLVNLPEAYQPVRIVGMWVDSGARWMDAASLQTVLALMLRDKRDDLALDFCRTLIERGDQLTLLAGAFQRSGRSVADVLALVGRMTATDILSPQAAADLYIMLLGAWEWRAVSFVQALARQLQQHPTLNMDSEALWHMLEIANGAQDDAIARTVARRLTVDFENVEDDTHLIDGLLRLYESLEWNEPAQHHLIGWWRGYVRGLPLARLQRLDKALDNKRALEDFRAIVQTLIAFRKLLGKRSMQQFAADVSATYAILQALVEAFDPTPKRVVSFDPATIRAELDAHLDELSPHEQKILGNNFKAMAQLIASMGDNRSKAGLIRRGDDVDRHLMTGEQAPHSAVDTLKWLAGYLGGAQEKDEESHE